MRKILFFFISFFILLGAMFIWSLIDNYAQEFENKRSTARSNSLKMNEETEEQITGYFYFGFIDMREKFEEEAQEQYFYYMDHYFQQYYNKIILPDERIDSKSPEGNYVEYFQEINGLNLLEISSNYSKGVGNGDYISIQVKGPVFESFPMQAKITRIEIIHSRKGI